MSVPTTRTSTPSFASPNSTAVPNNNSFVSFQAPTQPVPQWSNAQVLGQFVPPQQQQQIHSIQQQQQVHTLQQQQGLQQSNPPKQGMAANNQDLKQHQQMLESLQHQNRLLREQLHQQQALQTNQNHMIGVSGGISQSFSATVQQQQQTYTNLGSQVAKPGQTIVSTENNSQQQLMYAMNNGGQNVVVATNPGQQFLTANSGQQLLAASNPQTNLYVPQNTTLGVQPQIFSRDQQGNFTQGTQVQNPDQNCYQGVRYVQQGAHPMQVFQDSSGQYVVVSVPPQQAYVQQGASQIPSMGNAQQGGGVFQVAGQNPQQPVQVIVPSSFVNNGMQVTAQGPKLVAKATKVASVPEQELGKRKSRKRPRDPNAPKPARYAWNFFFKQEYKRIRDADQSASHDVQKAFTDLGVVVAAKWKNLSPKDRAPYVALALEDKVRFQKEQEEYEKRQKDPNYRKKNSEEQVSSEQTASDLNLSPSGGNETNCGMEPSNGESEIPSRERENGETQTKIEPNNQSPMNRRGSGNSSLSSASDNVVATTRPVNTFESETTTTASSDSGDTLPNDDSLSVMVCDDDDAFVAIVKRKLRKICEKKGKSLHFDRASDGNALIEKALSEKRKYMMITLDYELGKDSPNGVQVIERLRSAGCTDLILGISGNYLGNQKETWLKAGANIVVEKGSKELYKVLDTLAGVNVPS